VLWGKRKAENSSPHLPQKFVARLPLKKKFCVHISSLIELYKEREREKDFSIGTHIVPCGL
jgi:hypothetical protein